MPPPTLSKRGFAELIGVSPARVSQLIAKGLPVTPNGRIEPAAGRSWLAANVDPNRRRADTGPAGVFHQLAADAKVEKQAAEALTARLKAERLAGSLIDRAAALRAIETRARMDRDRWIVWVNRAAPELANALGVDLAAVVALLDRMVRDQLAALAETQIEGLEP